MKKLVLIAALFASSAAMAQKNKQSSPAPAAAPSYSSTKVLSANFGLNQGAINLGFALDSGSENGAFGGSFFLQTEKEDDGVTKVNQIMSFGAHVKLTVFDQANWAVDLRPGVNISVVNDVTTATGKDDKTVFGPALRWGATYRMSNGKHIGIERLEVWNWFDDDVQKEDAFTSFVFRTDF